MADETVAASEALRSFCALLKRLHVEADGPTVDSLAANDAIPLRRTRIFDILNGAVREPPPWDFVRPFVLTCVAYARQHGNPLSVPVDPDVWRAELHAVVRRCDGARRRPRDDGPPAAPVATQSLPPDVAAFVGRDAEIDALHAEPGTAAPAVVLITGMAGVGKTAVAVHAAHRLGERYPDGRIFLNLGGFRADREPMSTAEALFALLQAIGVPATVIPVGVPALAAAWRHRTHDRRLLLVLDDAPDAERVEALLPSAPGSLVLVTSRHRMPALVHARSVPVGTLSAAEAYDLFVAVAGRHHEAQAAAIRAVTARCGHLPLAVSLVAARLNRHRAWSVQRLLAELDEHGASRDVMRAAFDVSYHALDPVLRESFRRLSRHPGDDLDAWAAAAILGTDRGTAAARLEDLYANHLLDEASQDRFRFHALLREYAAGRAGDDDARERERAESRLLGYLVTTARAAGSFHAMRPTTGAGPGGPGPAVDTYESATRWLHAEIATVAGCVTRAWRRHPRQVAALSDAVHPYLRQVGPWDTALRVHGTAVRAARLAGDPAAVATALLQYGVAGMLADRYADATEALRESTALSASGGDPLVHADALTCLGVTLRFAGDLTASARVLTEAVARHGEQHDVTGEANATTSLAVTTRMAGDYRGAHDIAARAVEASMRSPYLPGRAGALSEYGVTQYLLGRYADAAGTLRRALDLSRALDNPLGEATALNYLGAAQYLGGDHRGAVDSFTRALALFRQLGERLGSADAQSQLGVAHCLAGDHAIAAEMQRQAIAQFRDVGSALGEATARNELGNALRYLGRLEESRTQIEQAIALLTEAGYEPGLEEVWNNHGRTELARGRPAEALADHHRALELADRTGVPVERARACEGIGRCLAVTTGPHAARDHLRTALAVYDEVGSPLRDALVRDFPDLAEQRPGQG